jgi:signal transduction histidine kinase
LANKLEDVTSLLQVISASRSVQEENVDRATAIFNEAQSATSDLADFYMWLDKEGRIVWISNLNQTAYEQYKGLDLSYRLYFSEPKATHNVYYSSVVDSNDGINRIYIAYPILGSNVSAGSEPVANTSEPPSKRDFRGVVVAGIRTDLLGKHLQSQISPDLKSQVGLTDHTGIILYSDESQFVGKNVFGVRFQSFLQSIGSETARTMSTGIERGLNRAAGSEDIIFNGKAAFVYNPILLKGKQFGVLYVIAPFTEVTEVNSLVESQKNLSVLLIIAISACAITAALVILKWNRNLENIVAERTAQLREANELLTVHDRLQREFINVAAHELRTPVQPILGMCELLESELGDRREDIRLIARNARRLERLTADILDVSKIESGSLSLNRHKIDLDEAISSVIIDYRNNPGAAIGTHKNKEKVEIKYQPRKLRLEVDLTRIQQVMSNLLSNALKFTEEGEVIINIEIHDDFVRVSVKDTGSGIDPVIMPRLFQKFATKSEKGTGLGLYISKNIVEAHGGKMWAENNFDGRGATFFFTLPR